MSSQNGDLTGQKLHSAVMTTTEYRLFTAYTCYLNFSHIIKGAAPQLNGLKNSGNPCQSSPSLFLYGLLSL